MHLQVYLCLVHFIWTVSVMKGMTIIVCKLVTLISKVSDTSLFFLKIGSTDQARFLAQPLAIQMRTSAVGTPIILTSRLPPPQVVATSQASINGAPPPLVSPPGEHASLMYNPYSAMSAIGTVTSPVPSHMDPYGLTTATPSIFEYQTHMDQAHAGMFVRRDFMTGM